MPAISWLTKTSTMDSKNILTANLLDLVFDNRNKDYGAYELRRFYNQRVGKALLITGVLVGITFTSIAISTRLKPDVPIPKEKIIVQTITPIEKKPDPVIPPAKKPQAAAQPVRSEIFTQPQITDDKDVQTPPPDQETLSTARISATQSDGVADAGIPTDPLTAGEETGIIQQQETKEPEGPFERVEVEAKFTGNWEKFLLRYLNGSVPVENGASPGRYTVMIQFVVDVDGSVSDIRPLTSLGFGMENEAIRVLKKATKWEPAIQNGRKVKAYRRQPVTFLVNEE